MSKLFLIENISPIESNLIESVDENKNLFLHGRFMVADEKNGNQRIYPLSEIENAVKIINEKIKAGESILGELNHPNDLSINLSNVSHMITELKMDNNFAIGKAKILNTPAGSIAKGLLEGGVRLGVSSRGTGNVTNEGLVEDFSLVTIDIVATPSGPGCYPNMVKEALENQKIMTLAEAVTHDPKAQKYFKEEMDKFIKSILGK